MSPSAHRQLFRASLLALAVAVSAPARAAPGEPSATEAQRLVAAAAKLARAGSPREALAALRRSHELAPSAATLRMIAEVQYDTKEYASALVTNEEVLARFGAKLAAREK